MIITTGTKGKQSTEEPLDLLKIPRDETKKWYCNALLHDNIHSLHTNRERRPWIESAGSNTRVFDPKHPYGDCHILFTNGKANRNNHPRVTVNSLSKNKLYCYHIVARAADIPNLGLVTKGKTKLSMTLCHLCGNAWCVNPDHLSVATKQMNDEQEYCHHFLRECKTYSDYVAFRYFCPHANKCWTNVYQWLHRYTLRSSIALKHIYQIIPTSHFLPVDWTFYSSYLHLPLTDGVSSK